MRSFEKGKGVNDMIDFPTSGAAVLAVLFVAAPVVAAQQGECAIPVRKL